MNLPDLTLTIKPAELEADRITVCWTVAGLDTVNAQSPYLTHGRTIVTNIGNRVWVETYFDENDRQPVLSVKHGTNEDSNDFAVLATELARIDRPITIPVWNYDIELLAGVAHTIIVSGRPEWM